MNEKTEYEKEWFQDLGVLILSTLLGGGSMIYLLFDSSFRFLVVGQILFVMLILGFRVLAEYLDMETINQSLNADSERIISDYTDKLIFGIWWIGNAGVWLYIFVFHKQFVIEFGPLFSLAIGMTIWVDGHILLHICIIVRHALKDDGN